MKIHSGEDINFFTMHIKGESSLLAQIHSLIVDDLYPKYGEKDCLSGMYIPVRALMRRLNAPDDLLGNIQSAGLENNKLTIELESESGVPKAIIQALNEYFKANLTCRTCR